MQIHGSTRPWKVSLQAGSLVGRIMSSYKWFAASFLGGATAFWLPDLLMKALYRGANTPLIEAALTLACPSSLVLFYFYLVHHRRSEAEGLSTAVFALFGIWLLSLTFMTLSRTFGGGGFRDFPFDWILIRYYLVSSLIPTRVFLLSMLDGTAAGLVLGTIAMIVCHFRFERGHWIIPPVLLSALRHARNKSHPS